MTVEDRHRAEAEDRVRFRRAATLLGEIMTGPMHETEFNRKAKHIATALKEAEARGAREERDRCVEVAAQAEAICTCGVPLSIAAAIRSREAKE